MFRHDIYDKVLIFYFELFECDYGSFSAILP